MRRALALFLLAWSASAPAADVVGTRVHIPVSVNGAPPADFLLDTGAARSPVDAEYASSIGIVSRGRTRANGAGGGRDVGLAPRATFTLAGREHKVGPIPLTPMGAISLRIGRPVSGVLGYEVLSQYVVEIDYANEAVTFHPRSFSPPREAVRLPIRFDGNLPLVDARITTHDGRAIAARLLVDTGAGTSFVLTRAFTTKHKITDDKAVDMSVGYGVGGPTQDRFGRLPRVSVGGFTFENPVVNLSRDTQGVLSSSGFDGLVGGELLRRFTLYVDYGRKQFALVPNAALREPFEFDMSGMFLITRDATFTSVVVRDVLPGSPAAEAGLRAGDEIREIDGKPVIPRDLDVIRERFREPGRQFTVTTDRGTVTLLTKRLL